MEPDRSAMAELYARYVFAQTGICYVTVPVGDTVTIQLTGVDGNPILGARGRITLQADVGRLNVTN